MRGSGRMNLANKFRQTVHAGLERKTLDRCSRWAEKCRVMGTPYPGPWTFDHHPWLIEMHDADDGFCVGQKAAQMGYTEAVLNRTFYKMDIRQVSVLYVLPAKNPDASDFSASRFDPALELSPYLQGLFSDVKNVGHKRAGACSLFIRGSRSRSGLKSLPVGELIFDEVDEMTQDNLPLAFERQSGQLEKQTWMISTPTIDTTGINGYFQDSSMGEFFFRCPACSRMTTLTFPDCIEVIGDDPKDVKIKGSFYKCKECRNKLEHALKHDWLKSTEWVDAYRGRDYKGFHINQMFSPTIEPWRIAVAYLQGLVSPAHEQEFFNSKMGLPHIVKGARVNDAEINQCIGNYKNGGSLPSANKIVTMGIDVGNWLHYVVVEWDLNSIFTTPDVNMNAHARVLEINKVLNFEDIDTVWYKYRPNATVIDSQPDRRKSYELVQRFFGSAWTCFYSPGTTSKMLTKTKDTDGQELDYSVTVDRTGWLDLSLSRYRNRSIILPLDTPNEFREQIKALVRKPEIDKNGNPIARYKNIGADHFGHATNYSEIALPLAAALSQGRNIVSPV